MLSQKYPTGYTLNQLIDSFSYQVDIDNKIILLLDDSSLSSNLPNLETGFSDIMTTLKMKKFDGTNFKEHWEQWCWRQSLRKGHIRRNLDRGDKRSGQGKLRVSSCCSVLVKGNYHFIFGLILKGIVPQFVFYRSVFVQKSTVKTH